MKIYMILAYALTIATVRPGQNSQLRHEKIYNVTTLLDKLLVNYQKSFRPNMNVNKPTIVYIDIYVRSMGPISELDGSYAIDCYFRQSWTDDRLTFSSTQNLTLSLGVSMLDKIWKPDTYFWNGKRSYLHKLTTPNRLVRLSGDGTVLYSARLTIIARCPMKLQKFPLDTQTCKLVIGSFGYLSHEVKYIWTKGLKHSVNLAPENKMSQFEVKDVRMFNDTQSIREAEYSALEVHFLLKRHLGYFLINFYIPCTLVVLMSWVALWINREATADRITLGVTSVLTMTFLSLDSRSDLPRVEYPTALDIYILICFAFLFVCILEFAIVHAYTKYNTGDPDLRDLEKERIKKRMEIIQDIKIRNQNPAGVRWRKNLTPNSNSDDDSLKNRGFTTTVSLLSNYGTAYGSSTFKSLFGKSRSHHFMPRETGSLRRKPSFPMKMYREWSTKGKKEDPNSLEINSISKIDRVARIIFPLSFVFMSVLYWNIYLID